jgi:pyridine nucleotide-disulfide oxidoreductase family protein
MKRVLLLGGGHAHLLVLRALAQQPLAGAEVMLLTPYRELTYSGMVPGLVAGHYGAAQCRIALAPLAAAAGVHLVEGQATALDTAARRVQLADGRTADYDVLSLDTGSVQSRDSLPGAREHGLFVRPIEPFVELQERLDALAQQRPLNVVVLGGGAAGFELALALQHRLQGRSPGSRVALLSGDGAALAGYPPAVMAAGARALARRRITVFRERAAALQAGAVLLASGARVACDAAIIATGAEPAPWLAGSGLALCPRGFVLTGPTLQSTSHAEVFAAGDVATRADSPHAKSGVYAVRAGQPLALNLQRFVGGGPLVPYQPQARTLNLLSCGGRSALTVWGGLGLGEQPWGRLAWWWKDRIDRAFIARFSGAGSEAAALTRAAGS